MRGEAIGIVKTNEKDEEKRLDFLREGGAKTSRAGWGETRH